MNKVEETTRKREEAKEKGKGRVVDEQEERL